MTQLVYADEVWANVTVERSAQQAREFERETLGLDVAFETAVAYLDVLSTRTAERIQREDLSLTRSNLELARLRVSVGTAGIPGASLALMTVIFIAVGIPIDGIALVAGVDRILDMCRTTVNITGDSVGSAVIAKSEGEVLEEIEA